MGERVAVLAVMPVDVSAPGGLDVFLVEARCADGRTYHLENYKGFPRCDQATAYRVAARVYAAGSIDPGLWTPAPTAAESWDALEESWTPTSPGD